MTAASKCAIASAAAGSSWTSGSSQSRVTPCPAWCAASTSTSPRVRLPSPYSAQRLACSMLTGQTRPGQPSKPRSPSTAARKAPLYCCIIDSSRLPPVCPPRRACSSVGSRASSTRRASRSLRASASAHFNTSPGGRTPSSSRRTPELPPLSNIVTTAFTESHGLVFNPPSRLGRPVPPPKQPMFIVRRFMESPIVPVVDRWCTCIAGHGSSHTYNHPMDLTPPQQQAIATLARDLGRVFGGRLESLVVYSGHDGDGSMHSLALIEGLCFPDLPPCLPLAESWQRLRLAVPLMLSRDELLRTVDIFPLEYASIIASHAVVFGRPPFDGMAVPAEDMRRACEAQAKSHLIHLREAFLESHGEARSVAALIASSA